VTVTTSGSVNTNVLGNYALTYTAKDSSNNEAVPKTRIVHVVDTTPHMRPHLFIRKMRLETCS